MAGTVNAANVVAASAVARNFDFQFVLASKVVSYLTSAKLDAEQLVHAAHPVHWSQDIDPRRTTKLSGVAALTRLGLAAVATVAVVVVIAVIFVVPMAFMHLPALLVMVVVRMAPIGPLIRRTLPNARPPNITATVNPPIAFGPHKAGAGHSWSSFVAQRRWSAADVNLNLCDSGSGKRNQRYTACEAVQLPVRAYLQNGSPFFCVLHRMQTPDERRFICYARSMGIYFFNSGTSNGSTLRATT